MFSETAAKKLCCCSNCLGWRFYNFISAAEDRHLNKTIKDRVYNAMNANTRILKGHPKAKPIKEPQDCYKLGRLPSLLRAQLQGDATLSFTQKVEMFQKRLLNALPHYFNDDTGRHASCLECGFWNAKLCRLNSTMHLRFTGGWDLQGV